MKKKLIIYISIFGVLTAIIMLNAKQIQNYINENIQQINGQVEDEATTLFVTIPVEW